MLHEWDGPRKPADLRPREDHGDRPEFWWFCPRCGSQVWSQYRPRTGMVPGFKEPFVLFTTLSRHEIRESIEPNCDVVLVRGVMLS